MAAAPNLALSAKTDQANRDNGLREYDVGVGLPLWLPGERAGSQALAAAEADALDSRLRAAQLRLAAELRTAWWTQAQAAVELELAQARLKNAERLAADVARRVRAGDLARADQYQADGAVATAQALLADARSAQAVAAQALRALLGTSAAAAQISTTPERLPPPLPASDVDPTHPQLRALADQAEAARKAGALAATQTRANPQLMLTTTRERGGYGAAYDQSITVGVLIPFGADNRQRARIVAAQAAATEAEVRLDYAREQVRADIEAARARLDAAQAQLAAAERRAVLARETRGFFDKSFRLGESDLPTRLRIELEAYEAERQYARSRIVVAQAVSQLRQALGLLPE